MVNKKNDSTHPWVDYRVVNEATIKAHFHTHGARFYFGKLETPPSSQH